MAEPMPQAYAPGNAPPMLSAMHVRTYGRTNEESILRHLQTDHRNLPAEADEICIECDRPAKTRGVCGTCYERHRTAGTRHLLPPPKRHQHTYDGCPICDEVTALTAYGWDARTILAALQRNAEHVLRHLRSYEHPNAEQFVPLATETHRHRHQRRKARP